MSKLIIHCPTQGNPYIVKNKKEKLEDLQELVGFPNYEEQSIVEKVNNKNWIIHPMFCEENKNWNLSTYSHFSSKLFSNSFTFYSLHSANTMDVICDFRNIKLF